MRRRRDWAHTKHNKLLRRFSSPSQRYDSPSSQLAHSSVQPSHHSESRDLRAKIQDDQPNLDELLENAASRDVAPNPTAPSTATSSPSDSLHPASVVLISPPLPSPPTTAPAWHRFPDFALSVFPHSQWIGLLDSRRSISGIIRSHSIRLAIQYIVSTRRGKGKREVWWRMAISKEISEAADVWRIRREGKSKS